MSIKFPCIILVDIHTVNGWKLIKSWCRRVCQHSAGALSGLEERCEGAESGGCQCHHLLLSPAHLPLHLPLPHPRPPPAPVFSTWVRWSDQLWPGSTPPPPQQQQHLSQPTTTPQSPARPGHLAPPGWSQTRPKRRGGEHSSPGADPPPGEARVESGGAHSNIVLYSVWLWCKLRYVLFPEKIQKNSIWLPHILCKYSTFWLPTTLLCKSFKFNFCNFMKTFEVKRDVSASVNLCSDVSWKCKDILQAILFSKTGFYWALVFESAK